MKRKTRIALCVDMSWICRIKSPMRACQPTFQEVCTAWSHSFWAQCVFILLPRSSCFSCVFASFSLNFFFFNWIKGTLNLIVLDNFQNCLLFLFPPDPFTYGVFTSGLRAVAPVTNSAHIQASALYCESSVTQSCQFFATPWTVAHQVSLCMGFFRQE